VQDCPTDVLALIRQAQAGDPDAFGLIVRQYQQMVFYLAYRMLHDRVRADDVTQDVFIRVYQSLNRFDPARNFATWLRQITVNRSIDYLRRMKHQPIPLGDIAERERSPERSIGAAESSPAQSPDNRNDLVRLRVAIDSLPLKYRTALVLRDIEGLEMSEIALIIKRSEATVRWRLHQARQILRNKLKPQIAGTD
jgi:RNA polymerase sigma-70 factor (ECF subfamily)